MIAFAPLGGEERDVWHGRRPAAEHRPPGPDNQAPAGRRSPFFQRCTLEPVNGNPRLVAGKRNTLPVVDFRSPARLPFLAQAMHIADRDAAGGG